MAARCPGVGLSIWTPTSVRAPGIASRIRSSSARSGSGIRSASDVSIVRLIARTASRARSSFRRPNSA